MLKDAKNRRAGFKDNEAAKRSSTEPIDTIAPILVER